MSQLALALAIVSTLPAALQATPAPTAAVPGQPAAYVPPGAPTTPPTEDVAAKELSKKFAAFIKCEEGRKDPLMHYCALTRLSSAAFRRHQLHRKDGGIAVDRCAV